MVPLWDLEVGQYSLSAAVSIYLASLVAEETHLWLPVFSGGGGGDGGGGGGGGNDGAEGASGVGGDGDGAGEDFSPLHAWRKRVERDRQLRTGGADRGGEEEGQGEGAGDRADGVFEGGGGREHGCRRGDQVVCGGSDHGHAIREWRERQRGQKRDHGQERRAVSGVVGGCCGEACSGAASGGKEDREGRAREPHADSANAHVLWATTEATFALE